MHGHELVTRGEGGSTTADNNVVCACSRCHMDLHRKIGGKLKRIVGAANGWAGPLRYFERLTGKDPWVEVFRGEGSWT